MDQSHAGIYMASRRRHDRKILNFCRRKSAWLMAQYVALVA